MLSKKLFRSDISEYHFVILLMLLQLENTNQENINRLLEFAKQNNLELSLVDSESDYILPGKPLTPQQLSEIIQCSRKSGIISMPDAHKLIRSKYNAD